jgi:hypothetical protein
LPLPVLYLLVALCHKRAPVHTPLWIFSARTGHGLLATLTGF